MKYVLEILIYPPAGTSFGKGREKFSSLIIKGSAWKAMGYFDVNVIPIYSNQKTFLLQVFHDQV